MEPNHLDPHSAAGSKLKQVKDAQEMQQRVRLLAKRMGVEAPPYDFLELIGKGSFGRVYKCKRREDREIVAIKIIDVDSMDYMLDNEQKDEAIADFIKEVNTLKQVKDSKAKNINNIQDAFDLSSQLWIVSDYCSGGSVHTLMKATRRPGLEERFIIPIARELAIALKHVHDAGVIHRDVKCGNVLISEEGELQLCDFGVAAIIESEVSKRSTIIGTPFWMPPEMFEGAEIGNMSSGYGYEVDCWAYGCTVYEMATGVPPNAKFDPKFLSKVLKSAPRLEGDDFSDELKAFVAFCLQGEPENRPSARQILEHPYIRDTSHSYPTGTLRMLIDKYIQWERKGGQRMSLFNHLGAAAPQQLDAEHQSKDAWIFSTTDRFDHDFEQRYSRLPADIASMDFANTEPPILPAEIDLPTGPINSMTPMEKAQEEAKAVRGERKLHKLFDTNSDPYEYDASGMADEDQHLSDLPLRNLSSGHAANRETLIDLDTSGLDMPPTFNFEFGDVPTVKANRKSAVNPDEQEGEYYNSHGQHTRKATVDWKFPQIALEEPEEALTAKRATMDWSFPKSAEETISDSIENANRRTMDWTFGTAQQLEEAEHESEPAFDFPSIQNTPTAPAFRPNLQRTATEPGGSRFQDFLHAPIDTLDNSKVGNRESTPMIDIDFDDSLQPTTLSFDEPVPSVRSSSPISISNSLTSIGPFDLEQDPVRREEDLKRYSHRRQQRKLSANHIAGQQRLSRSLHERRQLSQGGSVFVNRARGASIDSTASSTADEQMLRPSHTRDYSRDYNRSMGAKMRDQLRVGLQRTLSQSEQLHQHVATDSYGDVDTDAASYHNAGGPGYDTDSSIQDDYIPRITRPGSAFPQFSAPDPAALTEVGAQDALFSELDRLLAATDEALGYTAMVYQQREEELGGSTMSDSDTDRQAAGVASEDEAFPGFA